MTPFLEIIILLLLATLAWRSLTHLYRTHRAVQRQDLLTDDVAGCCESLGYVGCSTICCGVSEPSQIELLLDVEYDRYEIIVVLDSESEPLIFGDLISRYRLIRVNCSMGDELPSATMRSLYRSRQRSFRRLILIDRPQTTLYDDLDAALSVASYPYVLPIGRNNRLCPNSIESIAIVLSEPANRNCEMLYSASSHSYVFQREAIILRGGFSPRILRQATPFRCHTTYQPLTFTCGDQETKNFTHRAAIFLAFVALIIAEGLLISKGIAAATAVTALLILTTAHIEQRLCQPTNCSVKVRICHIRRIVGIFRTRNFRI